MLKQLIERSYEAVLTEVDLQHLNPNQAQELSWKLEAELFWTGKEPVNNSVCDMSKNFIKQSSDLIEKLLVTNFFPLEKSSLGSTITRSTVFDERMFHKLHLEGKNGKQMFGDNYQSVWLLEDDLSVVSYCEGDVVTYKCKDSRMLHSECMALYSFYFDN